MATAARSSRRGRSIFRVVSIAFALALMAMMASGILHGGGTIKFMIPTGYRGRIKLFLDPNGQELRPHNGLLVIRVPSDGVLRVRSFKPMERPHREESFYQDGTPIPQDYDASADVTAFRDLGHHWHGHMDCPPVEVMLFYIGTELEMDEYMRRVDATSAPDPF